MLVVLDACRYDLMREVSGEYEWVDGCDHRISAGGASFDWMMANFNSRYADDMGDTIYVTGNAFSREHVDTELFEEVDEVWRYGWDNDVGTVRPRTITDRAIKQWRENDPDRLIVHYMQPHRPFIGWDEAPNTGFEKSGEKFEEKENEFDLLRRDEITREEAWKGYKDTLRLVLNDVEVLLENVDEATTVVSADHGNAFGEFGVYAHLAHAPLRSIREVPWCEVDVEYRGNYEPLTYDTNVDVDDSDVRSRLEDLGYV